MPEAPAFPDTLGVPARALLPATAWLPDVSAGALIPAMPPVAPALTEVISPLRIALTAPAVLPAVPEDTPVRSLEHAKHMPNAKQPAKAWTARDANE